PYIANPRAFKNRVRRSTNALRSILIASLSISSVARVLEIVSCVPLRARIRNIHTQSFFTLHLKLRLWSPNEISDKAARNLFSPSALNLEEAWFFPGSFFVVKFATGAGTGER